MNYELHKKESDAKWSAKGKPTRITAYELQNGAKFEVLMATHPDHANMIGYHYKPDFIVDKLTGGLAIEIQVTIDEAIAKGWDRMIIHAPKHALAIKQVGHLSVIK